MSLINKMRGTEEPGISAHWMHGALVALADGQLTRTQIENALGLSTTGTDASELDAVIDTYNGITGNATQIALRQTRYKDTLHAMFNLLGNEDFDAAFTNQDLLDWLVTAAS